MWNLSFQNFPWYILDGLLLIFQERLNKYWNLDVIRGLD